MNETTLGFRSTRRSIFKERVGRYARHDEDEISTYCVCSKEFYIRDKIRRSDRLLTFELKLTAITKKWPPDTFRAAFRRNSKLSLLADADAFLHELFDGYVWLACTGFANVCGVDLEDTQFYYVF